MFLKDCHCVCCTHVLKRLSLFVARMFLKDCHCVCCTHVLKRLSLFAARMLLKDCHCVCCTHVLERLSLRLLHACFQKIDHAFAARMFLKVIASVARKLLTDTAFDARMLFKVYELCIVHTILHGYKMLYWYNL